MTLDVVTSSWYLGRVRLNTVLGTPVLEMDKRGCIRATQEMNSGAGNCFRLDGKCHCAEWHADSMRRRQEAFCEAYVLVPREEWMSCWRDELDGELYYTEADL